MSDLDIVVRLDPGQPVAGAKAVTAELAKTETQAKKTESAAEGIAKINFKQAAAGVAQAFGLINEKLKLTDTEFGKAAESAVKFGAMGAQVAGPWGAVAGALLGVALEGEGTFEMLERVADASKTTAERFADLTKGSSTFKGQLAELAAGSHSLSEAIVLVTRHLQNLHDATSTFSSLGPALKAVNDQLEAQKRILGDLNDPRTNFVRDMTALNLLFKNGTIRAADYVRQQSEMATGFAAHEGVIVKATKAVTDYAAALREAADEDSALAQQWADEQAERDGLLDQEFGGGKAIDVNQGVKGDNMEQWLAKNAEDWEKSAREAKKLEDTTIDIGKVFEDQLLSSAASFSDILVDAANGADVAWSAFGKNLLVTFEKAIMQAMILKAIGTSSAAGVAGTGLIGALGFASGGTIYPSGGGTADTQSVAFRKRPDETVHINTPQQERAYQRGGQGGGSTTVHVVDGRDPRALMQGGPDVQRVVLDTVRANPGAFRSLLR